MVMSALFKMNHVKDFSICINMERVVPREARRPRTIGCTGRRSTHINYEEMNDYDYWTLRQLIRELYEYDVKARIYGCAGKTRKSDDRSFVGHDFQRNYSSQGC